MARKPWLEKNPRPQARGLMGEPFLPERLSQQVEIGKVPFFQ